jgi:hypothetical protein
MTGRTGADVYQGGGPRLHRPRFIKTHHHTDRPFAPESRTVLIPHAADRAGSEGLHDTETHAGKMIRDRQREFQIYRPRALISTAGRKMRGGRLGNQPADQLAYDHDEVREVYRHALGRQNLTAATTSDHSYAILKGTHSI